MFKTVSLKKVLYSIAMLVAVSLVYTSCEPEEKFFDEALLIGKWKSGEEFYKYRDDGTGATWDESEDVTEAEAQEFTWTLVESELTHIHILEMGGTVPKIYTVTELTATTLKYKDDFGGVFSYTKVSQ